MSNSKHSILIFVLSLAGLFKTDPCNGQTDTLEQYYSVDFHQDIDKFEREHEQLNGKTAAVIPFRDGRLFGFVKPGRPGKFIIEPQFEQVYGVYKHGAIVKDTNHGYGFVNFKGEYIIPPYFSNLFKEGNMFHGSFYTHVDSSFGLPESYNSCFAHYYYNLNGNLLFSELTHELKSFIEGDSLAIFRFGPTYHIRSNTGRLVKEIRIDSTYDLVGISDNLIITKSEPDSNWHYTYTAKTAEGEIQFTLKINHGYLDGVYWLGPNHFGLLGRNGDYYFCDSNGVSTGYGSYSNSIGMIHSYAEYFNQQHFIVQSEESELFGIVDRNGKAITDFKYTRIFPFVNGRCFARVKSEMVRINGRLTETNRYSQVVTIDKNGIETVYNNMYPDVEQYQTLFTPPGFHDGLLLSKDYKIVKGDPGTIVGYAYKDFDSAYYVYIDIKGKTKVELPTTIVFAGVFDEGLAPAMNKERQLGFINKKGKWAIKPEYELAVAGAYPFPYIVTPQFIGGYVYIKAFKGYIDKKGNKYFGGERMKDQYDFSH